MAKKDTKSGKAETNTEVVSAKASDSSFSVADFLKGTREELGKVVWPSRQQLISESAAVILMVSLSATLIYFIDKFFGFASRQVF
ncbi:MAG: preprotein translocase subunit SecE [Leptolyngbyaceae cyanobacterium SM1_1_3]|nr:preprotein translocase subunit SecE [Leptolyngbyaceae cyanobacterium SM1_1_3]NJM85185.1 preprotein translocase subunit SecE [Leptolyngbyaceae cyanobacterium RM2_2_21]NJN02104.1 preprotein translocase subunit SecE [Leptolyngbyaceae cyanobacterium RM1_1_2]NJO09713.1 preprotein translocase subunit SecE [Leptolyngbyaceae cyanobacterium SL_1_1]